MPVMPRTEEIITPNSTPNTSQKKQKNLKKEEISKKSTETLQRSSGKDFYQKIKKRFSRIETTDDSSATSVGKTIFGRKDEDREQRSRSSSLSLMISEKIIDSSKDCLAILKAHIFGKNLSEDVDVLFEAMKANIKLNPEDFLKKLGDESRIEILNSLEEVIKKIGPDVHIKIAFHGIESLDENDKRRLILCAIRHPAVIADTFNILLTSKPYWFKKLYALINKTNIAEKVYENFCKNYFQSKLWEFSVKSKLTKVEKDYLTLFFMTPNQSENKQIEENIDTLRRFISDSPQNSKLIRKNLPQPIKEKLHEKDLLEEQILSLIDMLLMKSGPLLLLEKEKLNAYFSQSYIDKGITKLSELYTNRFSRFSKTTNPSLLLGKIIGALNKTHVNSEFSSLLLKRLDESDSLDLIRTIINEELERADLSTLFRVDSFATRLITEFQNKLILKYPLDEMFKDLLENKISKQSYRLSSERDFEENENNSDKEKIILEDQRRLLDDFSIILDFIPKIIDSPSFPYLVKRMNQDLYKSLEKKFNEMTARKIAPQLFFLRFLNPLIASVCSERGSIISTELNLSRDQKINAKRVSKCLQSLANRNTDRKMDRKEEDFYFFMEEIAKKGNKYTAKLESIVDKLLLL